MLAVPTFLLVLGFLVVAHELGHYVAAKFVGARVLEFGIGYPPRLLAVRWRGTDYSLNLLPLGGFVRLVDDESSGNAESLASKSPCIRLFVLAAGSLVNGALPLLLLTAVMMTPQDVYSGEVVVLGVSEGSPAAMAQIKAGDLVREVDGRTIRNTDELRTAIQLRLGANSRWLLERGGQGIERHLTPRVNPPMGQGAAGLRIADGRATVVSVEPDSLAAATGLLPDDLLLAVGGLPVHCNGGSCTSHYSDDGAPATVDQALRRSRLVLADEPIPVVVLRDGSLTELAVPPRAPAHLDGMNLHFLPPMRESKAFVPAVLASFGQLRDILVLFRNEVSRWLGGAQPNLAGPVGIARETGEIARAGIRPLLLWTALLSINLAILNLLPIPALDGGRITFVLLELARGGRRIPPEKERLVHLMGFVLLMLLVLLVSFHDIQQLVSDTSGHMGSSGFWPIRTA